MMTKSEKNQFLASGGMLIRRGIKNGEQIIKAKSANNDWHRFKMPRFSNATARDEYYDVLLESPNVKED